MQVISQRCFFLAVGQKRISNSIALVHYIWDFPPEGVLSAHDTRHEGISSTWLCNKYSILFGVVPPQNMGAQGLKHAFSVFAGLDASLNC